MFALAKRTPRILTRRRTLCGAPSSDMSTRIRRSPLCRSRSTYGGGSEGQSDQREAEGVDLGIAPIPKRGGGSSFTIFFGVFNARQEALADLNAAPTSFAGCCSLSKRRKFFFFSTKIQRFFAQKKKKSNKFVMNCGREVKVLAAKIVCSGIHRMICLAHTSALNPTRLNVSRGNGIASDHSGRIHFWVREVRFPRSRLATRRFPILVVFLLLCTQFGLRAEETHEELSRLTRSRRTISPSIFMPAGGKEVVGIVVITVVASSLAGE